MTAIALVLASCGSKSVPSEGFPGTVQGIFVGRASESDAFVAVVAGTRTVVATVVNGAEAIGETFAGPRTGDTVNLSTARGSRLALSLAPAPAGGAVFVNGLQRGITLEPAAGPAGLYRAAGLVGDEPVWILWVVLNDGEQRAAAGTPDGIVPAPRLDVAKRTFTVDGTVSPVADVQPDGPPTPIEDPGTTFAGGAGFRGGPTGFGGFAGFGCQSGFGACQFSGSFGSFQSGSFGGGKLGFGGGGFTPEVVEDRHVDPASHR